MKRRINVIGKICRIISMVIIVLLMIGASLTLITGIVLTVVPQDSLQADVTGSAKVEVYGDLIKKLPDGTLKNIAQSIREGSFKLDIDSKSVDGISRSDDAIVLDASGDIMHLTFRKIGVGLILGSVVIGCLIFTCIMFRRLMRELEICDSPFSDGVIKGMTGFAISIVPYAALKPILSKAAGSLITSGTFKFDFSFDLTAVFAALVIVLLIFVFKYGASLQKESDETL